MMTMFRSILALALAAFCATASAAMLSDNKGDRLSTVPHNPAMQDAVKASQLGELGVKFEGWNETFVSYARLRMYELTGRTAIPGQTPSYSVLAMMYEPQVWFTAQILPIEHPEILTDLNVQGKWISAKQVVENPKLNEFFAKLTAMSDRKTKSDKLTKLLNAVEQTYRLGRETRVLNAFQSDGITPEMVTELLDDEAALKAKHAEREEIRATVKRETPLRNAGLKLLARTKALGGIHEDFRVVPDAESIEGDWVTPSTVLASNAAFTKAGQAFERSLQEIFSRTKPELLAPPVQQFLSVAGQSSLYPTQQYRDATNLYINTNPWRMASGLYLIGTLAFAFGLYFQSTWGRWSGVGLMVVGFLVHTSAVGLRLFLKGHVPVSNMFEALTFMSWCVMLIAIVGEAINRRGLVGLGATLVGFLMLTGVAMMPLHESRIHPLRAVLNSYWLNIHVTMMLFSYAAFALAAVFAGIYLLRSAFRLDGVLSSVMSQAQTEEFAYRLVQLGWPLLTVGVTLGAVWADVAWGRAWGWDPKETWAFITWVTYTAYLHSRMVMGWRGNWSAAACVVGFVMVVITMLGVSYLPWFSGGLHSYASPT